MTCDAAFLQRTLREGVDSLAVLCRSVDLFAGRVIGSGSGTVLALDPSSSCTGFAVINPAPPEPEIVAAGTLKPKRQTDPYERVRTMVADFESLIAQYKPGVCVIEVTSGKLHDSKRGKMKGRSMAVYGAAVGAMLATAWHHAIDPVKHVVRVLENDWTNRVPKDRRAAWLAVRFPSLRAGLLAKGGDMADAVGVGLWWIEREAQT